MINGEMLTSIVKICNNIHNLLNILSSGVRLFIMQVISCAVASVRVRVTRVPLWPNNARQRKLIIYLSSLSKVN